MSSINKRSPGAKGIPQPFNRQAGHVPHVKPVVAQLKTGVPAQNVKQPVAPPAYHPQQTPNALQPKMAKGAVNRNPPVAPPVYRPRRAPTILQTKGSPAQSPQVAQAPRRPVAPPAYRPQATAAGVQAKMAGTAQSKTHPAAPQVYRPQPAPRVLQAKQPVSQQLEQRQSGTQPSAPPISGVVQLQARGVIQRGQGDSKPLKGGGGGGNKPPPPPNNNNNNNNNNDGIPNVVGLNFEQVANPPPPRELAPLYDELQYSEDDDDRNSKHAFNYWVRELLRIGKLHGVTPQPLTEQAEAEATQWIVSKMGGGGGSYGEKCKTAVREAVRRANLLGYHIEIEAVRTAIQSAVTASVGLGGTQMGEYKGDWRGGGFFDYDKMKK